MEKCFRCSLCKMVPLPTVKHPAYTEACPAARYGAFHGYSTSGKQIMALALLDGRITADEAMAAVTFACTACGFGDVACKFIMDAERHAVNMALREHLVAGGFAREAHKPTMAHLAAHGRPTPVPGDRAPWWNGLPVTTVAGTPADVLVLAGCHAASDPGAARTARRFVKLLAHAGLRVGVLPDEACCGLPAYWTGHRDLFKRAGAAAARRAEDFGASQTVALSGSCLGAYRSKIPAYTGEGVAGVLHATEFLWSLVEAKRLTLPVPVARRVTYHDPCYLGRQSEPEPARAGAEQIALNCMTYTDPPRKINRGTGGVYDAPRRLLQAVKGLTFVEMHRIREYALCCGGGGGVPEAYPAMARQTAAHRLDEAASVGADLLVTACTHCRENLGTAGGLPVTDVVDILFEASGLAGAEAP
jgi:Fe-S oxidoreductase